MKRIQMVGKSYVNENGERVWVTQEPHHMIMRTGWDLPM